MNLLTIFTPTYNREHTLPRLYESLKRQTNMNFEWLVINDGSTDDTVSLLKQWQAEETGFDKRFYTIDNGGKNRAINRALDLIKAQYFMILDSDDLLTDDAVEQIISAFDGITDEHIIGISKKRGDLNRKPLKQTYNIPNSIGYVECSNLERTHYGLDVDMAEVFYTEKLNRYRFPVWQGENFTPEEVIWNRIALDGYKLRWYNQVVYLCEYQQGGLSDSTWRLLRDNPMGYAMMYRQRIIISKKMCEKRYNAAQMVALSLLGGHLAYALKAISYDFLLYVSIPMGIVIACRRWFQFKRLS